MKRFAIFGFVCALLLGALLFANRKRQQTPAYLLRNYQKSDNLRFIVEDHGQPPADNIVFMTDWFDSHDYGGIFLALFGSYPVVLNLSPQTCAIVNP